MNFNLFPETLNVPQGETEVNIEGQAETKLTVYCEASNKVLCYASQIMQQTVKIFSWLVPGSNIHLSSANGPKVSFYDNCPTLILVTILGVVLQFAIGTHMCPWIRVHNHDFYRSVVKSLQCVKVFLKHVMCLPNWKHIKQRTVYRCTFL